MNGVSNFFKKIFGNKNTVTILGVIACLVVLYIGYNSRINKAISPVMVPVAKDTIQPRTKITSDMIKYIKIPSVALEDGKYYVNTDSIIGKYSNYNTVIPKGSLFYLDVTVDSSSMPNEVMDKVPEGYTLLYYPVSLEDTYGNSMMPGDYFNLYFKITDDDGKIMFGKFLKNVEILDVKDSSGKKVFENSEETRIPAYLLFALPEDLHLLLRKAIYLSADLLIIPNTETLTQEDVVEVSSQQIEDFILSKTALVTEDDLPDVEDLDDDGNNNEVVPEEDEF